MRFSRLDMPTLQLGEGPTWDERAGLVYLCDIQGRRLHAVDPARGAVRDWAFDSEVCSLGLCESGRLLVALAREIILFDPATGARETLARHEEPESHRFNDGKMGPDGRFYVGTMDRREGRGADAALYRFDPPKGLEKIKSGLMISNGLAWTPDGATMIHSDSDAQWIEAHAFDRASGAIGPPRRFAAPDRATGLPDGGACDVEGRYWSAGIFAGHLNRFALDGAILERHKTPTLTPTMPCFCGSDMRTLLVTSLVKPDSDAEAGGVFVARADVAGAPIARMRGL